jgi:hypothetical protein
MSDFLAGTQSHCRADTLIPPSKVPALNLKPYPISNCISPPSTYLDAARFNMSLLISIPSHMY